MNVSRAFLAKGAIWTTGTFATGQAIRFATNVALTRILAPELFGLMIVINSLRTGMELVLDIGIGQSIVRDPAGDRPEFYNSAWTLQILRGVLLTLCCIVLAVPIGYLFEIPILSAVLPVVSLYFLLTGFSSVARFILQRRMQLVRANLFDLLIQTAGSVTLLCGVYISPTVWGVVWGGIASTFLAMVGSYVLVPNLKHRLSLTREYVVRIFSFGKWIFLSSVVYFLSMNFDRLFLAKMIPLDQLGVYGLARGVAEILTGLFLRLGEIIIFPLIASSNLSDRSTIRHNVKRNRFVFLALAAGGIALAATLADLPFRMIFDSRYHEATSILPILILGTWFSLLSVTSEASLLGLGRPVYSTSANFVKFCYLIITLPVVARYGMLSIAVTFAFSDVIKYMVVSVGSVKERFSFIADDLLLTVAMLLLLLGLEVLRLELGLGVSGLMAAF